MCDQAFIFKHKRENINGLQLANPMTYPIVRYVMNPKGQIQLLIFGAKNLPHKWRAGWVENLSLNPKSQEQVLTFCRSGAPRSK